MTVFYVLKICDCSLFSVQTAPTLKQLVIQGVSEIDNNVENNEYWKEQSAVRGWEGGNSLEERLDQWLADADEEDTQDRWEELARRLRTYQ